MSVVERWARTQEQIARLHEARKRGDLCAACGRELGDDEMVCIERFDVGPRRTWHGTRQSQKWAPICAACASPASLAQAEADDPEYCVGCDRPVVYRGVRRTRKRVTCSLRCEQRASHAKHRGRTPVDRPPRRSIGPERILAPSTDGWSGRLTEYREGRGLSQVELAAIMRLLGRPVVESQISRWEHGHVAPRIETFGALAIALGVSMEALLYGPQEAAKVAEELKALVSGEAAPDA